LAWAVRRYANSARRHRVSSRADACLSRDIAGQAVLSASFACTASYMLEHHTQAAGRLRPHVK